MLDVVKSIHDVSDLDGVLHMPEPKSKKLREQYPNDEEYRKQLLLYFLKTAPHASWEGLAGGLLRYGETISLEEAKKKLKPNRGT